MIKDIFTERLNTKLIKYSIAAGAVLLGAKTADAQIWGKSVDSTMSGPDSLAIVFNGNRRFTIIRNQTHTFFTVTLKANTSKASWVGSSSTFKHAGKTYTNFAVKPLSSGYSVKPGDGFVRNNSVRVLGGINYSNISTGINFADSTKYIGVRFKISGDGASDWNYGWIKISVTSNADSNTIISYAYEETKNTAIAAIGTLPVELSTFTANAESDKVELSWKTATEVNDYGFEVQRSEVSSRKSSGNVTPSGVEGWEKIGFVEGGGNSNSPNNYSFIDTKPVEGTAEYRLKQINNNGSFKYSRIVTVSSLPAKFELYQNYPNPFNPTTTIQYSIPKAEHVTLKVYDELGREVSTLVDKEQQSGSFKVEFNTQQSAEGGTNHKQLSSGIYFYRLTAGNFTEVKKLMLLK